MLLMMLICLSISLLFMNMQHPMSMGLTLLIQTFFTCLLTGIYMKTFWYSYILFLIFIGGMLVLFIYMTSLSSNEMFSSFFFISFFWTFFMFLMIYLILLIDKSLLETMFSNLEMKLFSNFNNFFNENTISLNKIYNFPLNMITLLLINYLLLTLLMTVKITKKIYGPLRPIN